MIKVLLGQRASRRQSSRCATVASSPGRHPRHAERFPRPWSTEKMEVNARARQKESWAEIGIRRSRKIGGKHSARRRQGKRRNQPNHFIPIVSPFSLVGFSFPFFPLVSIPFYFFRSFFLYLSQWLALPLRSPRSSLPSPMRKPTKLDSPRPRRNILRLKRNWYEKRLSLNYNGCFGFQDDIGMVVLFIF